MNLGYDSATEKYKWRPNLEALDASLENLRGFPEFHSTFDKPTLFIRGSRSNYIRDEYRPIISNLFPNAKIETIQDAGHWVHAEKPDQVLKQLIPFLKMY